jgi:hypothetical protein
VFFIEHLQLCSVCDPAKNISHPSLVIYFFANPLKKTKSRTANWWESTDSKPPERGSSSQIIFVTLFFGRCKALLCLLPASANNEKNAGPKTFCLAELACFDFSSSNFYVQIECQTPLGMLISSQKVPYI